LLKPDDNVVTVLQGASTRQVSTVFWRKQVNILLDTSLVYQTSRYFTRRIRFLPQISTLPDRSVSARQVCNLFYHTGQYSTRQISILPDRSVFYQIGLHANRLASFKNRSVFYQIGRYTTDITVFYQTGPILPKVCILPDKPLFYQTGQYSTR
jgi:hypothetical protein